MTLLCLLVLSLMGCRSRADVPPDPTPASPPASQASAPPEWVVDGDPAEWSQAGQAEAVVAVDDPPGDATGPLDVVRLSGAAHRGRIWLRIDVAEPTNLYNGPKSAGTLVVQVAPAHGDPLRLDLRARRLSQAGRRLRLADVDLWIAPAHAATTFELALRIDSSTEPVEVTLLEGDRLDRPLRLTPRPVAPSTEAVRLSRGSRTQLRIVSFNVLEAGVLDPDRGPAQRRLIDAVDPDVILLQELGRADLDAVRAAVARPYGLLEPVDDIVGHGILSRHPLVALPHASKRFVAARVETGSPVVVVSTHLSCCGYAGSPQDRRRLAEVDELAAFLRRLQNGEVAGASAGIPVIVAGDFNDVGSRALRAKLTTIGLERIPLRHPRWGSAHTWGTPDARFPASVLDLIFTTARWESGFILDTAELTDPELARHGLRRHDSAASDHRPLVVDFTLRSR